MEEDEESEDGGGPAGGGPVDEEPAVGLPEGDEQPQDRQAHLVAALRHVLQTV